MPLSQAERARGWQGLGCIATLIAIGYLIFHFAYYGKMQNKYSINANQNPEVMVANAQGALNSLTSRLEPSDVVATVKTVELSGKQMRVIIVEVPTKENLSLQAVDIHACEWAERIAMVAPKGVTVRVVVIDRDSKELSRAVRPPGNKYTTHARNE